MNSLATVFEWQHQLSRTTRPPSREEREASLAALQCLLEENFEELVAAIERDFGSRSRGVSLMYDVHGSIGSIKYARKHLREWMRAERRKTPFPYNLSGAKVRVEYQPKGVVGILGTWNVPLFTVFSPLAQVIAAGNRALIKPSDLVPETSVCIERLMPTYLSPDTVAVITGDKAVSESLSQLPLDHIVVTGGTMVGKAVMTAAAQHLAGVTLELGGKSPVILGRSADIRQAAEKIIFAKVTNAGQLCVAADYVLVPTELLQAFLASLGELYQQTFETSPIEAGGIINQRHTARLHSYLEDARARDCQVLSLAEIEQGPENCIPLHLVVNPPADSLLSQEEIFGPILIVRTYDVIEDAIDFINAGERPLALYYFGRDKHEQNQVLQHTVSGGVTINQIALHPAADDAPFGGIGASGVGKYHGREGFLEFSHARTVFTQGWFDVNKLMGTRAPFGAKLQRQLESVLGDRKK